MEIILIDDVFPLGKRGQVVNVAPGYGRNYLIPKQLAVVATAANLNRVEQQRVVLAKKEAKLQEEAEILARELQRLHLILSRKSGESGSLFGSVTTKDLSDLLQTEGIHLDRRKILLAHPIKSLGNFQVEIRPHSEVAVELLVSVVAEGSEPIARVKPKDEESERVVAELNAKVEEMAKASGEPAASASTVEVAVGAPSEKSEDPPVPSAESSETDETEEKS